MKIVIDASNIKIGGGFTYLFELLNYADPQLHGFESIQIWACDDVLAKLPERSWLYKKSHAWLNHGLLKRFLWQRLVLQRSLQAGEVLFVPGGITFTLFHPYIAAAQNVLPYINEEVNRVGNLRYWLRLKVLKYLQLKTFRKADGIIYVSESSQKIIEACDHRLNPKRSCVIPLGIGSRFDFSPKPQRLLSDYSMSRPFKLLYVSNIDTYKNQDILAEAVAQLLQKGMPIKLTLIGEKLSEKAYQQLTAVFAKYPQYSDYLCYLGSVNYLDIASYYQEADAFILPSSCESFGQIGLEAMQAGLPIVSSNKTAMPEVLGEVALYFDPRDISDMIAAITKLAEDPDLRTLQANKAKSLAQQYSWLECASKTLGFVTNRKTASLI